jgi:putative endonuclease
MALQHPSDQKAAAPQLARSQRGRRAYLTGLTAEETVARAYVRRGCVLLAKRVRIGPGELDLVFRRDTLLVFVEVKSSCHHHRAIESLSQAQLSRIMCAADCYRARHPDLAALDMRVDLATVDQTGQFRVIPNITV